MKNLFIFISAVLIMLLGPQPAIAEGKHCVSILPEDNTAADPNSYQYRKGITDYYEDNERHNCKEVLLYIESYKPVEQKPKKIPIISLQNKIIEEEGSEGDPYQFFLLPNDRSFTNAVDSYMKKRLGDEEAKPTIISDNSTWSSWAETSESEISYVLMRGKDVNIPFAIQSANYLDYPVSKLIGYAWDNHDEDLKKLGEIANGYQTLSVINATTSKLIDEIGKDTNNIYWKLGVLAAIISSEAIDFAVEEFYDGQFNPDLNGGQVRWALENLGLSQSGLEDTAISNLVSSIKMDCNNHNILREIYIQKWDADNQRWDSIYDFIDENDGNEGEECRRGDLKVILDRSSDKKQKLDALNKLLKVKIKTLGYANLSNITLTTEKDLTGADLTGADLTGADLTGADLTGADLIGADLIGADLFRADLTVADLTVADLIGADLTGADLTGADLTGADLTGADLFRADLTVADLSNTILTAVNFYDVKNGPNENFRIPEQYRTYSWSQKKIDDKRLSDIKYFCPDTFILSSYIDSSKSIDKSAVQEVIKDKCTLYSSVFKSKNPNDSSIEGINGQQQNEQNKASNKQVKEFLKN